MKITLTLLSILILSSANIIATEYWNIRIWKKGEVRILKKSEDFQKRENLYFYNENGFYLHRNCIYTFEFIDGEVKDLKIVNIIKDTIVTVDFSREFFEKEHILKLDFNFIKRILFFQEDSFIDPFVVKMSEHSFEFIKEFTEYSIDSKFERVHSNSNNLYELIPKIKYNNLDYKYIYLGKQHKYKGVIIVKEDPDIKFKTKNFFWFTPNYVSEINGISIGVWTASLQKIAEFRNRTLKINGINLELNPMGIFAVPMGIIEGGVFFIYFPNNFSEIRESEKNPEYIVNGLNLNYAMFITRGSVNGLNIIGAFSKFNEINGLSISGLSNMTYVFNGLSISGFFNRSLEHNGVQIALINKTNDLRGIQIGLWNINNKRSLPLINWNFSD